MAAPVSLLAQASVSSRPGHSFQGPRAPALPLGVLTSVPSCCTSCLSVRGQKSCESERQAGFTNAHLIGRHPFFGGLLRPSPGREQGAGGRAGAAVAQTGAMSLPSVSVRLLRQHVSPFSSRALGREWDGRGARGEGGRAGKASQGGAECWGARSETRAGTVPPCLPAPAGDASLARMPAAGPGPAQTRSAAGPRPVRLITAAPGPHAVIISGKRGLRCTRDTPGFDLDSGVLGAPWAVAARTRRGPKSASLPQTPPHTHTHRALVREAWSEPEKRGPEPRGPTGGPGSWLGPGLSEIFRLFFKHWGTG